jgi:hypothetical protein
VHNGLHNLYSAPNIIKVIKSRRMVNHGRDEKGRQYFGRKTLREETTLVISYILKDTIKINLRKRNEVAQDEA